MQNTKNIDTQYCQIFCNIAFRLTILGRNRSLSNSLCAIPIRSDMWYLKKTVFDNTTYNMNEIKSRTFPTIKYTKALCTEEAPIARDIICAIAAKMPPNAWPPTVAVIYLGENFPTIPNKLPDNIALAPEILLF